MPWRFRTKMAVVSEPYLFRITAHPLETPAYKDTMGVGQPTAEAALNFQHDIAFLAGSKGADADQIEIPRLWALENIEGILSAAPPGTG